jgi:hypothetical protein
MFSGIEFRDEMVENAEMKELEYKGEKFYFELPTLQNECTVRCSCKDFYFTWMWPDKTHKVLFGNLGKPYVRKTTTRPPRNPDHIAGMCKHIYQSQSYLRVEGYMN